MFLTIKRYRLNIRTKNSNLVVFVIYLDLQMLAKVLNTLRSFPILANTASSVLPVTAIYNDT